MIGWIKIHRKLKDHWIWSDPIKFQWWLLMLLEANHKTSKIQLGNQLYEVKRGQSAKSLRTWASIFGCSPKTVSAFFKMLESDKMLVITTIGKSKQSTTLINITKYEDYQGSEETQMATESKHDLPTNKEVKKERSITPPSLEEIIEYFTQNGYKKSEAEKAFNFYANRGWKDSNDRKVKNWKLKMKEVWFKPENKIKPQTQIIPTFYY